MSDKVEQVMGVVEIMAKIRKNLDMVQTGESTKEYALERIGELVDLYEQGELLFVADVLEVELPAAGAVMKS